MRALVYILQCANGQFYVGSTNNLELRIHEHISPESSLFRGAKFTMAHHPVTLVYTEEYSTEQEAHLRERQLHKWSHSKKQALIDGDIELLKQLSKSK